MTVSWRVDELADAKGLNARTLAARAGLAEKTVRNILKRRASRVDLATIDGLCKALDVAPGDLWSETDAGDPWGDTKGTAGTLTADEVEAILAGAKGPDVDPALSRALSAD